MDNPGVYDLGDINPLTTARADAVITTGVAENGSAQSFIDRLAGMTSVSLQAAFDHGGGGTSCIAVVETSLDQGTTWIEICRFDFTTADSTKTANISAAAAAAVGAVAALNADSKLDGVLGDRLRCRFSSVGTYSGGTKITIRAVVR